MTKDTYNKGDIEIFAPSSGAEIEVRLDADTVWLNRQQLSELFDRDVKTLGKHINNVFKEGELDKNAVVAKFATTASDGKTYQIEHYNLDVFISVGYRVKSLQGTEFRIWATQRLKDHLVDGYAINEKRLEQKQQEVQHLKTGIRILSRAIEDKVDEVNEVDNEMLQTFAKGLALLDDYDHEALDSKGQTATTANYPSVDDFLKLIGEMQSEFESDVFAKPKDEIF